MFTNTYIYTKVYIYLHTHLLCMYEALVGRDQQTKLVAISHYATLSYAMLSCAVLCYAMPCYALPNYAMLYCVSDVSGCIISPWALCRFDIVSDCSVVKFCCDPKQ